MLLPTTHSGRISRPKREREFGNKCREMVKDVFGDRVDGMYEIESLATDPAAQGLGYGSALVRYVLNKVRLHELHRDGCS